jgi:DNA repair exonuclease SbcCD nuclease subunit
MKLVHAADLHLDSPLRGLSAQEGAPVERVREATRKAFHNLIDLCLKEQADALLLAGDVFDGDWKDFSTGLFFLRELERLRPMPVFLVRGNHDAMSEVTRQLRLPAHVHEFSEDAAETRLVGDIAVHGLSFSRRVTTENLVPRYPAPIPGRFNVGLLHTSCEGRPNHNPYAPCRVEELVQKGYDYWALGHVHAHEVLHERPWIVFPGNTQGRHIKETGAKGCVVVHVEGREARLRHVALDVVRWKLLELTLAEDDPVDTLYEKARAAFAAARSEAEGRLCAVRLIVRGSCRAHLTIVSERARVENELRALTFEWRDELWLEEIKLHTRPPLKLDELRASEGFLGELLRAPMDDLASALKPLADKIGVELKDAGLDFSDESWQKELNGDAQALVATRLVR